MWVDPRPNILEFRCFKKIFALVQNSQFSLGQIVTVRVVLVKNRLVRDATAGSGKEESWSY